MDPLHVLLMLLRSSPACVVFSENGALAAGRDSWSSGTWNCSQTPPRVDRIISGPMLTTKIIRAMTVLKVESTPSSNKWLSEPGFEESTTGSSGMDERLRKAVSLTLNKVTKALFSWIHWLIMSKRELMVLKISELSTEVAFKRLTTMMSSNIAASIDIGANIPYVPK